MKPAISTQNALKLGNALRDTMGAYYNVPANQAAYIAWLKMQTDDDCKKELARLVPAFAEIKQSQGVAV